MATRRRDSRGFPWTSPAPGATLHAWEGPLCHIDRYSRQKRLHGRNRPNAPTCKPGEFCVFAQPFWGLASPQSNTDRVRSSRSRNWPLKNGHATSCPEVAWLGGVGAMRVTVQSLRTTEGAVPTKSTLEKHLSTSVIHYRSKVKSSIFDTSGHAPPGTRRRVQMVILGSEQRRAVAYASSPRGAQSS